MAAMLRKGLSGSYVTIAVEVQKHIVENVKYRTC